MIKFDSNIVNGYSNCNLILTTVENNSYNCSYAWIKKIVLVIL